MVARENKREATSEGMGVVADERAARPVLVAGSCAPEDGEGGEVVCARNEGATERGAGQGNRHWVLIDRKSTRLNSSHPV